MGGSAGASPSRRGIQSSDMPPLILGRASAAVVAVPVAISRPDGKRGPNLLPEKYADPKTSGLTWTVKANEDNKLELNLTK